MVFAVCFSTCKEKGKEKITENTFNLIGNWVNEQKDTLSFVNNTIVEYKPYITNSTIWVYIYEISKDTITLNLSYSSSTYDIKKYYFKYLDNRIEIHNFKSREFDFYNYLK